MKTNWTKHLFQGLLPINRRQISKEVLAGLTLAIVAIPEVMGYTKISGTPIITGIYTILLPMIVFAFFGASRHLVVAADSATAAILAQGILPLAALASDEYMSYVVLLSIMVGVFLLICRVLRLGFVAKFLSRTVLVGFLTGVGIQVALEQISGILGVKSSSGNALHQAISAFSSIRHVNFYALLISAVTLGLILIPLCLEKVLPFVKKIPWALFAIVSSIIMSYFWQLETKGVAIVGAIPAGLPKFVLPDVSFARISALLPVALTITLVIITQSAATSAAYANHYDEKLNENQDLFGLGLANIVAGLSGTFVVNGSPTKTQIADEAGGRSQLANLFASLLVLLVVLFLTKPLHYLPNAALSALVFTIGLKLIDMKNMKLIYKMKVQEFYIALLTALVVVLFGAAQGIIFAMGLALVWHIHRSYKPSNSLMVPIVMKNGERIWTWQPLETHTQAEPGMLVYHFAASIYYANADVFESDVWQLAQANPKPEKLLFDFSAISDIDFTGGQVLLGLCKRLREENIRLGIIQAAPHVIAQLKDYGVVEILGIEHIYLDLEEVIREKLF